MRSEPISSSLFVRNRAKLLARLEPGDVALVCSGEEVIRSGDQFYPYRPHSDFFYLAGISRPGSVLVLAADCEILFIRKADEQTLQWSGSQLSREQASELSGIREVRWLVEMPGDLKKLSGEYECILHNGPAQGIMEEHVPGKAGNSLSGHMQSLRMIKEPEEIGEIRKACRITRSAFFRILGHLEPGVEEYRLEAEMTAGMLSKGARGHAFEPIVASGSNALVLHYVENSAICRKGDLVLLDFGGESNCYAADCSRTLPVSGRFTLRQKELYRAVHRIFLFARSMMVPGMLMDDFHRKVGEAFEEEHIRLGLYSSQNASSAKEPLWKRYFMHGTSHSLGLDVHDPFDRSTPFAEGMVLTCEPGIYIPEEGVGIRLENDILLSAGGPVDLMEDLPMDPEEVEDLIHNN